MQVLGYKTKRIENEEEEKDFSLTIKNKKVFFLSLEKNVSISRRHLYHKKDIKKIINLNNLNHYITEQYLRIYKTSKLYLMETLKSEEYFSIYKSTRNKNPFISIINFLDNISNKKMKKEKNVIKESTFFAYKHYFQKNCLFIKA